MVQKRNCTCCDGTGLILVDFANSIICMDCKGKGFHEVVQKQLSNSLDGKILDLLHIVSKHTTTQQYEQILSEMNEIKDKSV